MNSRIVHSTFAIWLIAIIAVQSMLCGSTSVGQGDDAALAAYADAANFQTGGATALAIEAWNRFVSEYPEHELASKALHYLGVCHMQSEEPNYVAAAQAFGKALKNEQYELREESLANQGWCLYALAGPTMPGTGPHDTNKLKQAIDVFTSLRTEFPQSRFMDRALFYSGEAQIGLGQTKQAIDYYDRLLTMPTIKESPLRCDALYARGVAYETLDNFDDAVASYEQLLDRCGDSDLVGDVHLRIGDVQVQRTQFEQAIDSFQRAFQTTKSDDDKSYALFRQAYALVQLGRTADAAKTYESLLDAFPDSEYASTALLASAQSAYRSGEFDQASKRFRQVLIGSNVAASTEAAHWLARIEIKQANFDKAANIVRKQIQAGTEGPFVAELQLDLAEILSHGPDTAVESMELFERVYRDDPDATIASRALYNAAFSALQIGQPKRAYELSVEFLKKFPQDTLNLDVQFLAAESLLVDSQPKLAAQQYQTLIASTPKDHPQRSTWLLRMGVALNATGQFNDTIRLLADQVGLAPNEEQKAEMHQLVGRAQILSGFGEQAIGSFQSSIQVSPQWSGTNQSRLLLGQALASTGDQQQAIATWNELIRSNNDSAAADQARYQIAQIAIGDNDYDRAIDLYREILNSKKSDRILPHAQYGIAWALMQKGEYKSAIDEINQMIPESAGDRAHGPLHSDAILARGICHRNLGEFDQAKRDLESFLATTPSGTNLGHVLYELALIDQKNKEPKLAAEKLQRLVTSVPDYPSMDKVLYELGWSLQESGDTEDAVEIFDKLVSQFPNAPLAADAAYYIGQTNYSAKQWEQAARRFTVAASTDDRSLSEKALYRLGWSQFKLDAYPEAEAAFVEQSKRHPSGKLAFDALVMTAECRFKRGEFQSALDGFTEARSQIRVHDETSSTIRDDAARQVRELAMLHGGQSAAQLGQWDAAIDWHEEHRKRFPSTSYLAQVFYETGFAHHQKEDFDNALKFYTQVADTYRNEIGARLRFMIGEIHFGKNELDQAIPEFQRVMFGYGAEKAPAEIKNWQAKSGFEAGRCSEVLVQAAKTQSSKQKALQFANTFYSYVTDKHAGHPLALDAAQASGGTFRVIYQIKKRIPNRLLDCITILGIACGLLLAVATAIAQEEPGPVPIEAAEIEALLNDELPADTVAPAIPSGIDLLTLVSRGGAFMIPIGLMSLLVVAIAVERLATLRRRKILPPSLVEDLQALTRPLEPFNPTDAYALCTEYPSPAARVVHAMLMRTGQPISDIERVATETIEREVDRFSSPILWLHFAASATPLMGLLGTVWGMIVAFHESTTLTADRSRSEQLSEGIYTALVTTLAGLIVAIPAAMLALYLENRLAKLCHQLQQLAFDVAPALARFRGQQRMDSQGRMHPMDTPVPPPIEDSKASAANPERQSMPKHPGKSKRVS